MSFSKGELTYQGFDSYWKVLDAGFTTTGHSMSCAASELQPFFTLWVPITTTTTTTTTTTIIIIIIIISWYQGKETRFGGCQQERADMPNHWRIYPSGHRCEGKGRRKDREIPGLSKRGWENVEGSSKGITSGDGGIGDSPKKVNILVFILYFKCNAHLIIFKCKMHNTDVKHYYYYYYYYHYDY